MKRVLLAAMLIILLAVVTACNSTQPNKYHLVKDEDTGYSYGAAKDGEFIADPALFRNSRLKLRIRNTTGDPSLNLYEFRKQLEEAYTTIGYQMTDGDDFGILLDINVVYFGQVTEMLPREYTFLATGAGAAVGAVAGAPSGKQGAMIGMAAGSLVGASIGEIIRKYATEETFSIVSSVTLATVMPEYADDEKTITFVTGKRIRQKKQNFKGFRSRDVVMLGVYAGGRMAGKSDIIDEVRNRYLRILKDII